MRAHNTTLSVVQRCTIKNNREKRKTRQKNEHAMAHTMLHMTISSANRWAPQSCTLLQLLEMVIAGCLERRQCETLFVGSVVFFLKAFVLIYYL